MSMLVATILMMSCLMMSWTATAMGPDPGGHTGATVTPETTRTDRPNVDAARKSASGSKTEASGPAREPQQAGKENKKK